MKRYLGDSVYVELDKFGSLILTTENGDSSSNRIIMEYEVYKGLKDFVAEIEHKNEDKASNKKKSC